MELLAIIRRVDTNGDATIDPNEWAEFLKVSPGPVSGPLPPPYAFHNQIYEDKNAS